VPRILTDIITAVAFVIVMIIVGKRAGFSVAGLITTSAVLTAVIGFALQDTLGNMMGGLALQMDNSVKAGDWISLGPGQPQGQVSEIRWRYTAIETRNWETILIPNGTLMRSQVTILGRRTNEPTQWRREFNFFVDFRTPPNDVITAVQNSLAKDLCEGIAQTPALHVILSTFRDSTAQYTLRYWLTDIGRDELVDSDLRRRIWYVLARANIKLSIPANAAFVTRNDDEHHLRKVDEDIAKRKAALRRIDLFSTMSDELISALAPQVAYMPFSAGETITTEGDASNELYLVVQGQAAVLIGIAGTQRQVAQLDSGQFFGEMSLMTGEARSATVRALTDLVCYRVDKAAFENLLRNAPYLADQIAGVLASRREVLSSARDEHDDDKQRRLASVKQDLVTRIRGFFSLDNDKDRDKEKDKQ
jgi:CRP-like cAMP-binding protein